MGLKAFDDKETTLGFGLDVEGHLDTRIEEGEEDLGAKILDPTSLSFSRFRFVCLIDLMWAWLEEWMEREQLTVAVPAPAGCPDSKIGTLLNWTAEFAQGDDKKTELRTHSSADGVTVRSCRFPGLPVFSVEWEISVPGCTTDTYLDALHFRDQNEVAAEWDGTFISCDVLSEHGNRDDLATFARLLRWQFRMPSPFSNREMLYIVVPTIIDGGNKDDGKGQVVLVNCVSVNIPRFPCSKSFARAYNLVPSFDKARVAKEAGGEKEVLELRHFMTTRIGGWVGDKVMWNSCFKGAVVANNAPEGLKVKALLQKESGDGGRHGTEEEEEEEAKQA